MNTLLSTLHKKRLVWSAKQAPTAQVSCNTTGFIELDEALGGGWPQTGVVALRSMLGVGELRLLLPYLQSHCQLDERLIVIINPPCPINAELLCEQGIALNNVLVVHADDHRTQLWCAEQCLKSGCCAAVLAWPQQLQHHQVKRFQLAAQQGDAVFFALHAMHTNMQGLPVSVAISLIPVATGVEVTISKRQGGWPVAPFVLDFQLAWPRLVQRQSAPPVYSLLQERLG